MSDTLGAFIEGDGVRLRGAADGPLSGKKFAAKDLFDVAGHVTGCGNPDWLRTHGPATATAHTVQVLLDAGAELTGKTITDELAFSLNGQNHHYGTPVNPNAPGRIPGGSSSGSASAVAGRLVDFALGTDTGGSIRVPGALCGIAGMRPSHGAIPLVGVMPLAPGFDTVGWLARDVETLRSVADPLLPPDSVVPSRRTLVTLEDGFAIADPAVGAAARESVHRLESAMGPAKELRLRDVVQEDLGDLRRMMEIFRILQGWEIWNVHGRWIETTKPGFGPDIADRFRWASSVTESAVAEAAPLREAVAGVFDRLLSGGNVLCMPTAATVAPRLDAAPETMAAYRERTLMLTSPAGLARLPQVTLPVGTARSEAGGDPCPVGISLIARRGSDRDLLDLAVDLAPAL
ncbi:MAG: amidase [Acidobacteriota bacterium]|nr:amidase [Acidobacteriota bacterium]